jgi:hypothetical protein
MWMTLPLSCIERLHTKLLGAVKNMTPAFWIDTLANTKIHTLCIGGRAIAGLLSAIVSSKDAMMRVGDATSPIVLDTSFLT